ncbi:MAG TPA: RsmD family RNA methyltransferase [Candidatus Mediterraneibacter faecavium]|uniref:RsmD family RNA methyltransferase n=1 Tax=Candidatus Mediterraneibacter faecavium TaxID=2838668 RepID=A0A9D2Q846_9FIRM|nr:RsmD family RNA methyltransferase [Candidatus Mediterraneibacter faecavium]
MFDIIYLDPPFTEEQIFYSVIQRLSNAKLLKRDGIFAIRTRKELEVPDRIEQLKKMRQKVYGISSVHFYGRAEG